jgi:DNA repair exonuclease SbcCD ATPase subunit
MSGHRQRLEQLERDLARYREEFQASQDILTTLSTIGQDVSDPQRQSPGAIANSLFQNGHLQVWGAVQNGEMPTTAQMVALQERLAYALVQLEHQITAQSVQTHHLMDQRLAALEQSVHRQISLFRQHIFLSLAQLDEKYADYVETQIAPLSAHQEVLRYDMDAIAQRVEHQEEQFQDLQGCVSDCLVTLHDSAETNHITVQWFIVVGVLLSLVCLLLPFGLQLRPEAQGPRFEPSSTSPSP